MKFKMNEYRETKTESKESKYKLNMDLDIHFGTPRSVFLYYKI